VSDKFSPIPLPNLLRMTVAQLKSNRFFGIPGNLFFKPENADPFRIIRYGLELETPVGVAAGPHTQLALNIMAAWLCGARYIELKTIQTLDELDVSKPCIDMQDEGYNCEWSQELKIEQSFNEYLNAWIMIHVIRHELGFKGPVGTIFNMSVGYNFEGIMKENVQWFLSKMQNCSPELARAKASVRAIYPAIDSLEISPCISSNVTLSTMHGCPPDEIEKIGLYLINEKKLHTTIKLNPTLLGNHELTDILNHRLGFGTKVPDIAFEHDLKYVDALSIIDNLRKSADNLNLTFSLKLTNTLESLNNKQVFNEKEQMMYMSGRALHPVSVKVAHKLQNNFGGTLDISFSAGVDCFNIAEVVSCGLKPATVCSDLLKPGGYGRIRQYIDNLRNRFSELNADSIDDYIVKVSGNNGITVNEAARQNLAQYAATVTDNPAYHKYTLHDLSIKTSRPLGFFDCIHAPCVDTCPTHQDIPEYMHYTAKGDLQSAFETIFRTNPFPSVTGMVCDHLCQLKCTRINYDEALQIREIKRFVAESYAGTTETNQPNSKGKRVAIIGAGPAGLSCAWFLKKAGFDVDIYEQAKIAGGMVSAAIPAFRLTGEAIEKDIRRILASGVKLFDGFRVDAANFETIRIEHDAVFLAAGAQKSAKLNITGIEAQGVLDPLDFLFNVKKGVDPGIGNHVVIIGGGNTAMDAARTAFRLVGDTGTVTIVYRRTLKEMPADKGEIKAVKEEGIDIVELTNPEIVVAIEGKVTGLQCSKNILAMKGADGRPAPIKVPGSEFEIPCDTIIPAIGQQLDINFVDKEKLHTNAGSYRTSIEGLYIGGDAMRGASTAINAIADGRKAAVEIISDFGLSPEINNAQGSKITNLDELLKMKATRLYGATPKESSLAERKNFDLVTTVLSPEEAHDEASRCLHCDEICNVCVSVCPNLANFSYSISPVHYRLQKAVHSEDGQIGIEPDADFIINQPYQILNIRDLCNECGNCDTFCPTNGSPHHQKPGLCLTPQTLNSEHEGYLLSRLRDREILIYKHNESIKTLTLQDNLYIYETDQVKATLNPVNFSLMSAEFLTPCVKECRFNFAAEMSIIMEGARQLVK